MYEVEAKVRLNRVDLKRLREILKKMAQFKGKGIKIDDYYNGSGPFSIRLRQKDDRTASLNIKAKKRAKGMETNQEIKLPIRSKVKFHQWLKQLGIRRTHHKKKISTCYDLNDFHIELNHIVGLGDYLEIEIIAQKKEKIPEAKLRLHALFKKLGFLPHQFEKKYYLELLQERR